MRIMKSFVSLAIPFCLILCLFPALSHACPCEHHQMLKSTMIKALQNALNSPPNENADDRKVFQKLIDTKLQGIDTTLKSQYFKLGKQIFWTFREDSKFASLYIANQQGQIIFSEPNWGYDHEVKVIPKIKKSPIEYALLFRTVGGTGELDKKAYILEWDNNTLKIVANYSDSGQRCHGNKMLPGIGQALEKEGKNYEQCLTYKSQILTYNDRTLKIKTTLQLKQDILTPSQYQEALKGLKMRKNGTQETVVTLKRDHRGEQFKPVGEIPNTIGWQEWAPFTPTQP